MRVKTDLPESNAAFPAYQILNGFASTHISECLEALSGYLQLSSLMFLDQYNIKLITSRKHFSTLSSQ